MRIGSAADTGPGRGAEALALGLLAALALPLCGVPLALVARIGLAGEARSSLTPLTEALESRSVRRALWNSLDGAENSGLVSLAARRDASPAGRR